MEVIHNMELEEMIITVYSDADFSDCQCKIVIMYYENVATICYDKISLSKKEVKQLCSKCFIKWTHEIHICEPEWFLYN